MLIRVGKVVQVIEHHMEEDVEKNPFWGLFGKSRR